MLLRRLPALILLPALLFLSGLTGNAARAQRTELSNPAITPGDFAGLVVMSGFRPIAVDMLWIRSEDLARERRYYELLSLYELITALDPHFDGAWVYNAHNLAFRLAELENSPQKRWRWTREALLYAMEGMKKNPDSDEIAFVIAYIYYYRVGRDEFFIQQVLQDPDLNPDREPVIELARYWAERGFRTKPHTIFIDWTLEFIYTQYGAHTDNPAVKADYLRKRLAIWHEVEATKPYAAKRAAEKVKELEEALTRLQSG